MAAPPPPTSGEALASATPLAVCGSRAHYGPVAALSARYPGDNLMAAAAPPPASGEALASADPLAMCGSHAHYGSVAALSACSREETGGPIDLGVRLKKSYFATNPIPAPKEDPPDGLLYHEGGVREEFLQASQRPPSARTKPPGRRTAPLLLCVGKTSASLPLAILPGAAEEKQTDCGGDHGAPLVDATHPKPSIGGSETARAESSAGTTVIYLKQRKKKPAVPAKKLTDSLEVACGNADDSMEYNESILGKRQMAELLGHDDLAATQGNALVRVGGVLKKWKREPGQQEEDARSMAHEVDMEAISQGAAGKLTGPNVASRQEP